MIAYNDGFPNDPLVRFGDPALDANFQASGIAPGRVYCVGLNYNYGTTRFAVVLWRSDNGGRSWGAPKLVAYELTTSGFLLDHPSLTVTQLNGYLYVIYSRVHIMNPAMSEIRVAGSADGGNTFGSGVCVIGTGSCAGAPSKAKAPQLASDPSGKLYAVWVDFSPMPSIKLSRSITFGTTFEAPQSTMAGRTFFIPEDMVIGKNTPVPIAALTLPMIRFNSIANRLGVVWHERVNTNFSDAYYTWYDAATNLWSNAAKLLNTAGPGRDHFMPALDADSSGNVVVEWYDRRNDPNNVLYELYGVKISSDGTRIGNEFPVTTFFTDPTAFKTYGGAPNHKFLGDYHTVFRFRDQSQWIDAFVAARLTGHSDIFTGYVYY